MFPPPAPRKKIAAGGGTTEAADRFDLERPSAYRRLKALREQGDLRSREIGNSLLWQSADSGGSPDTGRRGAGNERRDPPGVKAGNTHLQNRPLKNQRPPPTSISTFQGAGREPTGGARRYDAIQKAATFYDCNRSNAIAFACEDVAGLVAAARRVLERDDLTVEQRREIAATLSTRAVTFEVTDDVEVTTKGEQ